MNRSYALIRTAVVGGLAAAAVLAGAMFSGPKVAFADSPDGLSSGQRVVGQTCTGSGADYKCLYCIYADGIKDCFWVKVPEPKPATPAGTRLFVGNLPSATSAAPVAGEFPWQISIQTSPPEPAKEVFIRSKPHVNVGSDTGGPTGITYESENLCQIDDGFGGTIVVSC